jgi:hypothetical protein
MDQAANIKRDAGMFAQAVGQLGEIIAIRFLIEAIVQA